MEHLNFLQQQLEDDTSKEETNFRLIVVLNNLGAIHCELGNFEKGRHYLNEAYNNSDLPRESILNGVLLNNLGYIEYRFSGYIKASSYLNESLVIKRNQDSATVEAVSANSLYNKAALDFKTAYYSKSLDSLKDALCLYNKVYGEDSWFSAMTESLIAFNHKTLGRYQEALDMCTKSLQTLIDRLHDEHPEVATTYHTLGTIYFIKGDYQQAMRCHEKSLTIRVKVYTEKHYLTAFSIHSIGNIHYLKEENKLALENYEAALNIRTTTFGEQSIDVGILYSDIGQVYCNLEIYPKAIKFLELAMSIYQKIFRKDHPDIGTCYNNLGILYEKMGEPEKALKLLQKSYEIYKKISDTFLPIVAINLNNMGSVLYSLGNLPKAISAFQDSISLLQKTFGDTHPDIALSYGNLGFIYEDMEDYRGGLFNYVKSLRKTLELKSRDEKRIPRILERIATIKEKIRDNKDAVKNLKVAQLMDKQSPLFGGQEQQREYRVLKAFIDDLERKNAMTVEMDLAL